jgi:hypothetical protein
MAFASLAAQAAAPVLPTCNTIPSRTTGTAPLAVFFDASGVTDDDLNETTAFAYHQTQVTFNFGDGSAGVWGTGANTQASKNFAVGPVASHVYETAGSYTVAVNATDGTNNATPCSISITVTAADTTFATTATTCFSNASTFTGCPSGATQTASSNDFDAAITACLTGATKRCLFEKGGTWAASATSTISADGPWQIGSYGTGAEPVITKSFNGAFITINGTSGNNDMVVTGLDFRGGSTTAAVGVTVSSSAEQVLVYKNIFNDVQYALKMDLNSLDLLNQAGETTTDALEAAAQTVISVASTTGMANGQKIMFRNSAGDYLFTTTIASFVLNDTVTIDAALPSETASGTRVQYWVEQARSSPIWDQIFFHENTVRGLASACCDGDNAIFAAGERISISGNTIDNESMGEHGVRTMMTIKGVYSNNTLTNIERAAFTLRAGYPFAGTPTIPESTYSGFGVVTNNKMTAGSCGGNGPQNAGSYGRSRDWIWQGNHCIADSADSTNMWSYNGVRGMFRNNILDMSANATAAGAVGLYAQNTDNDVTDYVWFYNNTVYRSTDTLGINSTPVFAWASTTNIVIKNNLCYTPLVVGAEARCVVDSSTLGTVDANSTDEQTNTVDPFESTPSNANPITYRPSAAAYADDGGVAAFPASAYDFGNCTNGATIPIGAWHVKTSICTGAAKGATQ